MAFFFSIALGHDRSQNMLTEFPNEYQEFLFSPPYIQSCEVFYWCLKVKWNLSPSCTFSLPGSLSRWMYKCALLPERRYKCFVDSCYNFELMESAGRNPFFCEVARPIFPTQVQFCIQILSGVMRFPSHLTNCIPQSTWIPMQRTWVPFFQCKDSSKQRFFQIK